MESDDAKLVKCPFCKGTGQEWVHDARYCSSNWGYEKPIVLGSYATCWRCGGIGLVAEVVENEMVWQLPLNSDKYKLGISNYVKEVR